MKSSLVMGNILITGLVGYALSFLKSQTVYNLLTRVSYLVSFLV